MPYRNLPPFQRPWREQRTGLWFAAFVVLGVIGAPFPSRSLTLAMAGGALILSVFWVTLGLLGLYAWIKGDRDGELGAMRGIAALLMVHGLGVVFFAGQGGYQTGGLLIAAGLGTLSWARTRYEFGLSRTVVEAAVQKVNGDRQGRAE